MPSRHEFKYEPRQLRNGENMGKPKDSQWEFQDPKMEVLYHIRPYLGP